MKIVIVKAFPSDPTIVHIAQPMAPAIHQNDSMLPAITYSRGAFPIKLF